MPYHSAVISIGEMLSLPGSENRRCPSALILPLAHFTRVRTGLLEEASAKDVGRNHAHLHHCSVHRSWKWPQATLFVEQSRSPCLRPVIGATYGRAVRGRNSE